MAHKAYAVLSDLCLRLSRAHPELGAPSDLRHQLSSHAQLLARIVRDRGMDHALRKALDLLRPPPSSPRLRSELRDKDPGEELQDLDLGPRWSSSFCALCAAPRPISSPTIDGLPLCDLCAGRAHHPQVRALIAWRALHPQEDLRAFLCELGELAPALLDILARVQRQQLARMRRYGP